jgi:hypothetical protein
MLPHQPWMYFPSGQAYAPPTVAHGPVDGRWPASAEWESVQGLQRHLLQTGYVDKLLGLLISETKEVGLYHRALIVVVADHGHSFAPGEFDRELSELNLADVLSVPLFIKRPGQRVGVVSDRNVETIDILPTIADELGFAVPWSVQGHSLFDPSAPERPQKVAMRTHQDGRTRLPDLRFDTASLVAARDRTVARMHALFGSPKDGLFDIAPGRDRRGRSLLGRHIATLPRRASATPLVVQLPTQGWFANVRRDRGAIGAHVVGRVREEPAGGRSGPHDLAVVVNGTVEAVTRTFPGAGEWIQFTAMLREDALLDGRNRVDVFEVAYESDAITLIPTSGIQYSGPAFGWRMDLKREQSEARPQTD